VFSATRTCVQAEQLNVSASGQSGLVAMQTMYRENHSNGWDSYAWAWVADANKVEVARGGRPLAAAGVDGGVAQGHQVHRRRHRGAGAPWSCWPGGSETAIAQVICTVPGRPYVLSFTVCDASNGVVPNLLEALAMHVHTAGYWLKGKEASNKSMGLYTIQGHACQRVHDMLNGRS